MQGEPGMPVADTTPTENRLRHETSPYLLQHADNPVAWRAWGAEALAEARAADRPILLSIGYAACHWCHAMAHESFEDPDTAALMNALFVCIKVDREERPDIDHLYMAALQSLGEQGGWPLTMFLTPAAEPFWGGTYFPPEPRWGRPSFRQVLKGVAEAYRTQKESVSRNVAALRQSLTDLSADRPGPLPGPALLDRAASLLLRATDPTEGGLRGAPKFPNPPLFRFLWQNSRRICDSAGADAVRLLLTRMCAGGIHDHLGGGFARYATDAAWLVPHFEKMLYDNAQLLDLLALAHADAPEPAFAAAAAGIVRWLVHDMTAEPRGGHAAFAASEDADSEGEEGRFYVWTESEIDTVLGADSPLFKAAFDVTAEGNWEGRTILRRRAAPADEATQGRLDRACARLLAARASRPRPARDDKVLADWNGLAITALCRAAAVFGQPSWLTHAVSAYTFIRGELRVPDGRIQHAWRLGRTTAAGLLDDQANMARAALAMFETTGQSSYLDHAIELADVIDRWFAEKDGAAYTTAADVTDLPLGPATRFRTPSDNATPAGNGLFAEVLARLHHLTGEQRWRTRAEAVLRAFGGLGDHLTTCPTLLAAADLLEEGALVVVSGPADGPAAEALAAAALASPDPAVCVLRTSGTALVPPLHPAHGKAAPSGTEAVAFVCRAGACSLPLADPAALSAILRTRGGTT
jgi:uncharacterized protein YyaL (SSP411 family)